MLRAFAGLAAGLLAAGAAEAPPAATNAASASVVLNMLRSVRRGRNR